MKNNIKRTLMLICACFLVLSFAKEQAAKVSLEIQEGIQKKQLIVLEKNIKNKDITMWSGYANLKKI